MANVGDVDGNGRDDETRTTSGFVSTANTPNVALSDKGGTIKMMITESATQQVMEQILKRGYFHRDWRLHRDNCTSSESRDVNVIDDGVDDVEDDGIIDDCDIDEDDDLEAFRKWQNDVTSKPTYSWDAHCGVIPTQFKNRYYTPKGLWMTIIDLELPKHNGRATLHECNVDCDRYFFFSSEDGVASAPTLAAGNNIVSSSSLSSSQVGMGPLWRHIPSDGVSIVRQGGGRIELVSDSYWEQLRNEITTLVEKEGSLQVSDLCRRYSVPRDSLMTNVLIKLVQDDKTKVATLMDDSMRLVSNRLSHNIQEDVITFFTTVTEPVYIADICRTHDGWDVKQVIEWLQMAACHDYNTDRRLDGEVHMDASATTNQSTIFVPTVHRIRQEKDLIDFVTANGYITAAHRKGVTPTRMVSLVMDAYPDAIVLVDNEVIVLDTTLQQLQVGIQEFLSSSSSIDISETLDLNDYLPSELLQSHLVTLILERIGFTSDQGVAVITDDRTILVQNDFVRQMNDNQLSRLIHEFAKTRAEEIIQATTTGTMDESEYQGDDDVPTTTGKTRKGHHDKSKSKRSSKGKNNHPKKMEKSRTIGEVPLSQVANMILRDYPSFLGLDSSNVIIPDSVQWEEDDDDDNDNDDMSALLLVSFCRKAFYNDKFRIQCEKAVEAELERLRSERDSKARLSRKDTAAKIRSVESSFHDGFVTLCYLIQAQMKFITYASELKEFDDDAINELKGELLRGPCADLTSRITQHCLFQEEQDCIFSFTPQEKKDDDDGESSNQQRTVTTTTGPDHLLPPHCSTVEITYRTHPTIYLSCPPPREPLPILRESFSGNSGIVLARQWTLCGGDCYLGGIRMGATTNNDDDDDDGDNDGNIHQIRPGNMEGFLSHVESNCLTLCGLPFKRLDKKAEKTLLFTRKQQLTALLAATTTTNVDAVAVLEYTIMILYQQVRNVVVSGRLLRGPILNALVADRKNIPLLVGTVLLKLNDAIDVTGNIVNDEQLIHLVRDCGLCRDIAKYDTTPLRLLWQKKRNE